MAKTAVVFKSKYGATQKYAFHIAQTLEADMYDLNRAKKFGFEEYDTIIFGGGIYASRVNGIKFLSSNAETFAGKNIIIFTTGLGDPTVAKNAQVISKSLNKSLPKEIMEKAHLYNFRGCIDYSKLSLIHKMMMSMFKKMIEKKSEEELSDDDRRILESYGKTSDLTDLTTTLPLIDYVRGLK